MKKYVDLTLIIKQVILSIYMLGAILLFSSTSHAAVIVQEDFEGFPSNWTCGVNGGDQGIWASQNCFTASVVGYNEKIGTGYNGSKGFVNTFASPGSDSHNALYNLIYSFSANWPTNCKEIYNRWYMKIDTNLDKSLESAGSLKLWRYYAPNSNYEIYLHVQGSTLKTGVLELLTTTGGSQRWTLSQMSSLQDGAWHCLEIRMKLNSNGSTADGEIDYWLDGNTVKSYRNINWFSANNAFGDNVQIGVGNVSDAIWSNSTPASFYFDNFIISTTKNGTITGSGSNINPPIISNGSPSGTLSYGTTTTNMSVTTDETATCKYGTSDDAYAFLPYTFSSTGGTSHSQTLSGLTNGGSYNYYVRCIDSNNNADTSGTLISFNVSNSTPVVNGSCGTASGSSFTALTSGSSNLCATGTVTSFSGTGPWTWGCSGAGGGTSTASNACTASLSSATLLLSEDFENNSFGSRGWYDGPSAYTIPVTSSGCYSGSCLQWSFSSGGTNPTQMPTGAMRKIFTASDAVFVDYYIKFPTGWREQTGGMHHEMHIAGDFDDAYVGMGFSHLMTYIEHWGTSGSSTSLTPHLTVQDGANIDQTHVGVNLTATSENRSVAGCNGLLDSIFFTTNYQDSVSCYDSGAGAYWNGKTKGATAASMTLNAWHHVQAYLKMNSISNNKGVANGTIAYWLDGVLQFRSDSVMFRTNQNPTMKFNQFIIAPYMGNGSPQAQSFYIDSLKIYNSDTGSSASPGSTALSVKSVTNP